MTLEDFGRAGGYALDKALDGLDWVLDLLIEWPARLRKVFRLRWWLGKL